MGVHDYICFVERNEQNIEGLRKGYIEEGGEEEEGEEYWEEEEDDKIPKEFYGIIVIVPDKYSKLDILNWKLTQFREFPIMRCRYSWDNWYFDDFPSYKDVLHGYGRWYDQAIWSDSSIPNRHLVTFHPGMYEVFVLGKIDHKEISNNSYKNILKNRGLKMPKTKELAYNYIVDCGKENIAEYLNNDVEPLKIPEEYENLKRSVLNRDLFTKVFTFKLENTPSDIHVSRLGVLIKDNVGCGDILDVRTHQLKYGEHNFYKEYNPNGTSLYLFQFRPKIKVDIKYSLIYGCVICGKSRCKNKYTCIDHYNPVGPVPGSI